MERREKKPMKMSVPQFGGWEHKAPGVPTDYSMVFNQARENKKTQKTDLAEVKQRLSNGSDQRVLPPNIPNHRHAPGRGRGGGGYGYGHARDQGHALPRDQDPPVMGRRRVMSYMSCCRPPM